MVSFKEASALRFAASAAAAASAFFSAASSAVLLPMPILAPAFLINENNPIIF